MEKGELMTEPAIGFKSLHEMFIITQLLIERQLPIMTDQSHQEKLITTLKIITFRVSHFFIRTSELRAHENMKPSEGPSIKSFLIFLKF